MVKKKLKYNNKTLFLVGDFETNAHLSKPNLYLGSYRFLYHRNIRRYFFTIKQFFQSLSDHNQKNIIIYFHNLEFDFSYCWNYIAEHFRSLRWEEDIKGLFEGQYFKILQDEFSRLYCVDLFWIEDDKIIQKIRFLDSFKLLGQSVEVLGSKLNYPKQTWNYSQTYHYKDITEVPSKLIRYLDTDIDIVATYLLKMPKFHMTIGGSVYAEFKQYYTSHRQKYLPHFETLMETITEELWTIGKQSYYGGFCNFHFKKQNTIIPKIYMYDVNSMYPTRCTEQIPYGVPTPTQHHPQDVKLYRIYIYEAKLKLNAPCGIIPKKRYQVKDNFRTEHYYRHVENKYFWVWENEFLMWKTFYYLSYKIEQILYQPTKKWVSPYILENYKLRQKAKEEKNVVDDKRYKDKLNNLTGKPSENPHKINKYLQACLCSEEKTKHKLHIMYENDLCFSNVLAKGVKKYRNIFFTSFITSQSRTFLFKLIWKYANIWCYTDTDSFYTSEQISEFKISNKLGEWDLTIGTNFKVLRPKCYIYTNNQQEIIPKISGLSAQGKKQVNYENFFPNNTIPNANLKKERTLTGMRLKPRPFKI